MAERILADDLIVTMTRRQLRELINETVLEAVLVYSEQKRRGPDLLTCRDLGERIKRNPQSVPAWVRQNNIPHVCLSPATGKEMRFVWDDVVARLKEMSAGIDAVGD